MDKIYKVRTENLDIGRITILENGDLKFEYIEEYKNSDYKPLFDFPDKSKSYHNHFVGSFLVNRLNSNKLSNRGVLSFYGNPEVMEMLKSVAHSSIVVEELEEK